MITAQSYPGVSHGWRMPSGVAVDGVGRFLVIDISIPIMMWSNVELNYRRITTSSEKRLSECLDQQDDIC